MNCARCGAELPPPPYFRRDECPACGADLHACVLCAFYSPGLNNDCREPQADRVVEKDRANFCDFFQAGSAAAQAADAGKSAALAALDKLFKT